MYGEKNYFYCKVLFNFDIGLFDKIEDGFYFKALCEILFCFIDEVQFDQVFYFFGVDVIYFDKFGCFSLSLQGCWECDEFVFKICKVNNLLVVISMGGGYLEWLVYIVEVYVNIFWVVEEVFF